MEIARDAFDAAAWRETCALLERAAREGPLEPEDLVLWARSAYLTGDDVEADDHWLRAHEKYLERGDVPSAARCAFWLGLGLFLRGQMAQGGGWLGRAHTVLEGVPGETVEHGYLLVPAALHALGAGDTGLAFDTFARAGEVARRFDDRDLLTLARLGQGTALVRRGDTEDGLAQLDEAMVAVIAGEVDAMVAGMVFCQVIESCQEAFDVRRAQEWTEAMTHWCAEQPDLVPYRGQCSVYRAEVLRVRGSWEEALDESLLACERLSTPPPHPATGMAFYEVGELRRLRGELDAAMDAYRQASRFGHDPQPGLALLDLARGHADQARAAVEHALEESVDPLRRSRLLVAAVETALASGDVSAARTAVDELVGIATEVDAPALHGTAEYALGAVQLAECDERAAGLTLRQALRLWQEVAAPYEIARTRVMIAECCRRRGEARAAELDLDSACSTFEELGAAPDLVAALAMSSGGVRPGEVDGLSPRELEVLRLVASGRTNREIAGALRLSEHTVRRHLQNIYVKLDVQSRSAATAYAFTHHLV